MFKIICCVLTLFALTKNVFAEVQIIDGQKVVCEDGVCMIVDEDEVGATNQTAAVVSLTAPRLAQGYMKPAEFLRFLRNEKPADGLLPSADQAWWLILVIAFLGGLSMNLTPCVLPMVPINLMIIGRSAARGALYGLGIALAYGTMGLFAALGGTAFGEIQGNPWFNLVIAVLFIVLSLALFDVFFIDFSKRRAGITKPTTNRFLRLFFPFVLGAVSAVLAGACVAPVLIAVLLLTADLTAKGVWIAAGLPFILGLGMAFPWPFAGAGLKVLPKPGAWMTRVNKLFGVLVLAFAAWYGYLAWTGFFSRTAPARSENAAVVNLASPADFRLSDYTRPVLVDCWASWCKNCSAMERETFADPVVQNELTRFTVVRLQAEDLKALKSLEGFSEIKGLPAFLIFETDTK